MPVPRAQLDQLTAAWQAGRDASGSPQVQAMVRAEIARIHREFDRLTRQIQVQFTDRDPYTSYEQMRADVLANRRMLVWKGASDTPLWDPLTNWKARALHDWDHIQHSASFEMPGELVAYRVASARMPGLAPLYLSEIVLQAAVQTATGNFEEQKLVLPPAAVVRVVDSLRGEEAKRNEPAAAMVWYAAGMLKVMPPAQLVMHLGARGLPLETALIITDAATMLNERRV